MASKQPDTLELSEQHKQEEIEESKNPKKDVTSTDSAIRYTAYAKRITQIFRAAHRYVAYTSDIGESFRPVAHPVLVKLGYSISWIYVLGDISFETWRAKLRQQGSYYPGLMPWQPQPLPNDEAASQYNDLDWRLVGLKRTLFQSIASMGLPALTIHTTVRYSVGVFKKSANKLLRSVGPVACGLAVVPLLPYVFDKPVEIILDKAFYGLFPRKGIKNE